MTDYLTAAFLGFIEGLTEFIPVSSTGHLVVLVDWLGFPSPPGHVFEVFIQLGAILAVVLLYWQKLWSTFINLPTRPEARHFAAVLIVSALPALVLGALGHDFIKEHLYSPLVIGIFLVLGGLVILFLDRPGRAPVYGSIESIPLKTAFLVGCAQSVALIPGVSRSGATIMGALGLGLTRPAAAELSFFMAMPVMFAAVAYDTLKSWDSVMSAEHLPLMMTGFITAFLTALVVVKAALRIISHYGFAPFAWYRIAAGLLILALFPFMGTLG